MEREDTVITKSLSYEAYLDQDILTVLLLTEYTPGESRCEPWIFDLSEGGRVLATWELAERLLGMDYAEFLWITNKYIANRFVDTCYEEVHTVPESQMSEEQLNTLENYRGILRTIPRDLSCAFGRYIFPADGEIYLVYGLPLLTTDWYSGLRTVTKTVLMDQTILGYSDMVTATEAVEEVIYNSTVHVMGASDQAHADLLRIIFDDDPYSYIAASVINPEYAVNSLLNYATEDEQKEILEACNDLERTEWLSEAESEVIKRIFQVLT